MGVQNQIYAHKIKLVGGTKELSRNPEYSLNKHRLMRTLCPRDQFT